LAAPYHPITPTVSLVVPTSLNQLDDVLIDPTQSTGAGGRPWQTAQLSIQSSTPVNSTLFQELYLGPFNAEKTLNRVFIVPGGALAPGRYQFTLQVVNFLSQAAQTTATVQITAEEAVPRVSILGPSVFSISANDSIYLQSYVQPGSYSLNSSLTYTWSVTLNNNALSIPSESKDPRAFKLSGHTLDLLTTYSIHVMVKSSTGGNSTATVQVFVDETSLIATIAGGKHYIVFYIIGQK
jgi:hypothetical protein